VERLEKDHLKNLGIERGVILRCILKKEVVRVSTGLIWLWIKTWAVVKAVINLWVP
jgi:hypothetical protein